MGEGVDHQRQDEPPSSQKQLLQQLPDRRRGTAPRQGFPGRRRVKAQRRWHRAGARSGVAFTDGPLGAPSDERARPNEEFNCGSLMVSSGRMMEAQRGSESWVKRAGAAGETVRDKHQDFLTAGRRI